MPASVTLPWGGFAFKVKINMTTFSDGDWEGEGSVTLIDWDGISVPASPGLGNPNVPNPVVVYNSGIYTKYEYGWQRDKCPPWERWGWKPGTKPRSWLWIKSPGCTGLYAALSRPNGVPIQHKPEKGPGIWYFEQYGQYASSITVDIFLANQIP